MLAVDVILTRACSLNLIWLYTCIVGKHCINFSNSLIVDCSITNLVSLKSTGMWCKLCLVWCKFMWAPAKLVVLKRIESSAPNNIFMIFGSFAGSSSDVTKNDECEGLYSFVDFKASAVCYINPLITGRYVGVMTTKSQILQLCEVEVYSRGELITGLSLIRWVRESIAMMCTKCLPRNTLV